MNKTSKTALPVILGMIIVVVALVYGLFVRPNFHRIAGGAIEFSTLQVSELNTGLNETVSQMGDCLYVASEEGLTKYDLKGTSIWNKSYHMDDPQFIVQEPYLAVVNLAGKNAYIFNEDGILAEVKTDYTIVGGYLNATGYLSLVLENGQENYIYLYDQYGEKIIERRTLFKKDGYPIDVAISANGTKMMTSHLDISQHMIASTVTFLDFSSTGETFEDRVVGHERLSNIMASKLLFLGESKGVVVGDQVLNFYEVNPTPSLLNSIPVNAVIEEVVHTENELIVSYGDAQVPEGEIIANSVVVYTSSGTVVKQLSMEEKVTALTAGEGTFFIIQSSKVTSYKSGEEVWEAVVYKPLSGIYPISGDRFLLTFEYNYEIVEIRDI